MIHETFAISIGAERETQKMPASTVARTLSRLLRRAAFHTAAKNHPWKEMVLVCKRSPVRLAGAEATGCSVCRLVQPAFAGC